MCIFGYAHISDQIFSVIYVEVFSARPGVKLNFWIQDLVEESQSGNGCDRIKINVMF